MHRFSWLSIVCLGMGIATGCSKPAAPVPEVPPTVVAKGTPVRLVLLQTLDSGGTDEGARVALMVAEDVVQGGKTVVRRGAPAEGVVVKSRSAGTLSALANTPARLSVRLERTWGVDGSEIALSATGEPNAAYEFTRSNTGRIGSIPPMSEAGGEDDARRLLETVAANLEEGRPLDLRDEATSRALADAADRLGMGATKRLIQDGEISKAASLLDQVRQGGSAAALANGAALPTVAAALELARWAGDVGSRMSRMLKGRNIKAHLGTPVEAAVAQETSVKAGDSRIQD